GLPGARVVDTESVPGGGTLPGVTIPSAGIRLPGDHVDALRRRDRPVIARVDSGATFCDLRTVAPADDHALADALADVLGANRSPVAP
ncbi:MAG: L-seryl-tRNA(Sec) selenium transferase, partial [Acidimicrobiia bacterium]|nr:L-seryl-tRNA(Sec) selenium transferase [Acidimicrobiia bacterium]